MQNSQTPFVSVIVPVYNDSARLNRCLQALEAQSYPNRRYEVIVVDNGSDSPLDVEEGKFPHARCVTESQRSSYAARNTGVVSAVGEVLAFTDSDCIPASDWLERGTEWLARRPDCGLVGGEVELFFQTPGSPTAVELCDSFMHLTQQFFVECMRFSVTANLMTTRTVFERVGPFDAHTQSGGDKEWGQRVFAHGYPLLYAANVRVAHPARSRFAQLWRKQLRLARGRRNHIDWTQHLPPFTWSFESILLRLPPLPPLFKVVRRRDAGWATKAATLLVWGIMQATRYGERWRLSCLTALRFGRRG